MKRILFSTAIIVLSGMQLFAQSELPEEAPNEAAVLKDVKFDFPNSGVCPEDMESSTIHIATVVKMEVGPPKATGRSSLQTTLSCIG